MIQDWQSKDYHIVSLRHTGTTFTKVLLRDGFGVDKQRFSVGHVGVSQVIAPPPPMLAGEKTIIPWRWPELYMLSCLDWDETPAFQAYKRFTQWAQMDNVFVFDLQAEDRDAEIQALADFLGLPVPEVVDWSPKNEYEEKGAGSHWQHVKEECAAGRTPDWVIAELAEHGLTPMMAAPR